MTSQAWAGLAAVLGGAAAALLVAGGGAGWVAAPRRPVALGSAPAPASTRRLVGFGAVVGLSLVVGLPATWWVPAAILVGSGLGGWRLWSRRHTRREQVAVQRRVLDLCEHLAGDLGAGQPPGVALSRASRAWPALAPVAEAFRVGADVPSALRAVAARPGAGDLRLLAAAWQVAHRTGQGLADAVDRVGVQLVDARATRRLVQGELASARATARLVAGLPVVALAMGSGVGGDPIAFLLTRPAGWACLGGGLSIGLLGLAWIEAIARDVDERA